MLKVGIGLGFVCGLILKIQDVGEFLKLDHHPQTILLPIPIQEKKNKRNNVVL